jgi:hypothetical protein
MKDIFLKAIEQKLQLTKQIESQMKEDVEKKILSDLTIEKHHIARESLKAAQTHLIQDKWDDAIYLFSRGCWNLGEFQGRSQLERGKK